LKMKLLEKFLELIGQFGEFTRGYLCGTTMTSSWIGLEFGYCISVTWIRRWRQFVHVISIVVILCSQWSRYEINRIVRLWEWPFCVL
jgi:hypothetical protein